MLTSDFAAFIELTTDCEHGASVTLEPPDGAVIVRRFRAAATGLVAIEVRPGEAASTIVVTRPDHSRTIVHLPHSDDRGAGRQPAPTG